MHVKQAWSQTDDHTNPGARLAASTFGRVPIATATPVDALFGDDHTNPGERLAVNSQPKLFVCPELGRGSRTPLPPY